MPLPKILFVAGLVCAVLALLPMAAGVPWLAIGLACVAGGLLLSD
jgi:hypothetical protein